MKLFLVLTVLFLVACARADEEPRPPTFERIPVPGLTDHHASTGGVSWADIDGDGDHDLLVTNGYDVSAPPAGQPNRLYRNDGGSLVLVTVGPLAESASISSAATWGDYDGDGDLDVFIANQQDENNLLFRNEGNWNFQAITDAPMTLHGGHSYAATWVDVDGDGHLDLFVANGGMSHLDANHLYRNLGDGSFETIVEGELVTEEAATCGIAWGDYDDDGDLDLYLVNTGFAEPANIDALYRNDGEFRFTKVEDSGLTEAGAPSSGAQWVDIDNDLDLDLCVTVMYGLANQVYRNDGGTFAPADAGDLALDSGYTYTMNFEDYDNDGDLDAIAGEWGGVAALYFNDGRGKYTRARSIDVGAHIDFIAAMASADVDGDGRIDVIFGNWPNLPGDGERNALLRNVAPMRHWLGVRFAGSAIGGRVTLTTDRGTQMREIVSQHGFRGQSASIAHFGLGDIDRVPSLTVRFPSGKVTTLENARAGEVLVVSEH
jgi:hypothetical protein